jgi:hypothetical protein
MTVADSETEVKEKLILMPRISSTFSFLVKNISKIFEGFDKTQSGESKFQKQFGRLG